MYKALYRKYRPKTFLEVLGQDHITKTLKNQIKENRTSHAYIFTGTRGTGKTSCAKILARAINCENQSEGDPCNVCPSCVSILSESAVDVSELDAASNNKVDDIRQILDETRYTPQSLKKRVYIIDEVHMLTTQAFNALLKTLEEPPEYVVFILATTEIHKVLPTILSRCQRYDFRRISSDFITNHLINVSKEEGITLEQNAAGIISKLSDGGLRDALSILDRCISADESIISMEKVCERAGVLDFSDLLNLAKCILEKRTLDAINLLEEMYIGGKELSGVLEQLINLFRDLLLYKIDNSYVTIYNNDEFLELSKLVSTVVVTKYIDILANTLPNLQKSHSKKIDSEMCIIRLCNYHISDGDTLERLELLEDKIDNFKPIVSYVSENPSSNQEKVVEKPKKIKKEPIILEGREDIKKLSDLLKALSSKLSKSKYITLKNSTKILFSDIEILIYGDEYVCTDIIDVNAKTIIRETASELFEFDLQVKTIISETTERNDTNLIDDVLKRAESTNIKIKTLED